MRQAQGIGVDPGDTRLMAENAIFEENGLLSLLGGDGSKEKQDDKEGK